MAGDPIILLTIRTGVTCLVLAAAFVVLLRDGYPDATQKWAYGAIGVILGY